MNNTGNSNISGAVNMNMDTKINMNAHTMNTSSNTMATTGRRIVPLSSALIVLYPINHKTLFNKARYKRYGSNIEMEKWFDPALHDFIDKELIPMDKK